MDKKYKTIHFKFLKSLNILLIVMSVFAVLLVVGLLLIYLLTDSDFGLETIILIFVIVFPIVLFVVYFVGSIIFSRRLAKKQIYVNDLSRLESLVNIDVLCLEKTNAITDGELEIKKVIPSSPKATEQYLTQWISNYLSVLGENDAISRALRQRYDLELTAGVVDSLPYNEKIGYGGVSFTGGKTIVLGGFNAVPIANKSGILKRCEEYINNGYQILVIGEGKEVITNDGYLKELEVLALIILKEHVRDDAFETFKLLKNNGITVKVISSDDALSASVVAAEAGIENSDKYISLEAMGEKEIRKAAYEYTVFGSANAGQKRVLIDALRENKRYVCMIGKDYNDLTAMKEADFSIATNSVEDDVKKEADMIIEDKSFKTLSVAIDECNSIINNLRKATVLFLPKTIFTIVMALLLIIIPNNSPFAFSRFLLFDLLVTCAVSTFLLIENDSKKTDGRLSTNSLKEAIPASIMFMFAALFMYLLYPLQNSRLISLGIYSIETVQAMIVVSYTGLSIAYLFKMCSPLNKYRIITFATSSSVMVVALIILAIVSSISGKADPLLKIPFASMNAISLASTIIIVVVLVAIYLFIDQIIAINKGDND